MVPTERKIHKGTRTKYLKAAMSHTPTEQTPLNTSPGSTTLLTAILPCYTIHNIQQKKNITYCVDLLNVMGTNGLSFK